MSRGQLVTCDGERCPGREGRAPAREVVARARNDEETTARVTRWGWVTLPGGIDLCPSCKLDPGAHPDPMPQVAGRPVAQLTAAAATTAQMRAVVLVDEQVTTCPRCTDGDHHLCHGATCRCAATRACGGTW